MYPWSSTMLQLVQQERQLEARAEARTSEWLRIRPVHPLVGWLTVRRTRRGATAGE